MAHQSSSGSFWTTLPGILTGIAAVITAVTALLTFLLTGSASPPDPPATTAETDDDAQTETGAGLTLKVNFQSPDAEVPDGYLADFGQGFAPRTGPNQGQGMAYGWVHPGTDAPIDLIAQGRDRNRPGVDQRQDTLIHMAAHNPGTGEREVGSWEISVPNDTYLVTVGVGDAAYNSLNRINAEGVTLIRGFRGSERQEYEINTRQVEVTDGRLTLDSTGGRNTKINFVTITVLNGQ